MGGFPGCYPTTIDAKSICACREPVLLSAPAAVDSATLMRTLDTQMLSYAEDVCRNFLTPRESPIHADLESKLCMWVSHTNAATCNSQCRSCRRSTKLAACVDALAIVIPYWMVSGTEWIAAQDAALQHLVLAYDGAIAV